MLGDKNRLIIYNLCIIYCTHIAGPVFAPSYDRVPSNITFYYDGKEMALSELTEEVGGFYAKMLDHDYTTRDVFNSNFFKDWRKVLES